MTYRYVREEGVLMMKPTILLAVIALALTSLVLAADPPELVNYQGVLRNSVDEPLDGSFSMTFRFFDALSGGDEILVDTHGAVNVSDGLFNVELGSGSVTDGSGPGEFTTLSEVFAQHTDLYLQVEVAGEMLLPRTRVAAAGYALNARRVRGVEIVSDGDLELWVDGAAGDDANNGLDSTSPKKTIMGAVNAIPIVLNGDVTVHIKPGTYQEEIVLSGRHRNGLFTVLLQQDVLSPEVTAPSVLVQPPAHPCGTCSDIGILVMDEIVRLAGIKIDGFNFLSEGDPTGHGIIASGSTNLTLANVIISNNHTGIFGTDGHFVELEANCSIEGNDVGLRSSDHGSFEVNGPFASCDNGSAARASRNSWIRFEGSLVDCVFCPGDGSMVAELYSSITVDGACSGLPSCSASAEGLCPAP